jgi:hypothetical protein
MRKTAAEVVSEIKNDVAAFIREDTSSTPAAASESVAVSNTSVSNAPAASHNSPTLSAPRHPDATLALNNSLNGTSLYIHPGNWSSNGTEWNNGSADSSNTNSLEEHFDDDGKYHTEAARRAHYLSVKPAASCYEAKVGDFPSCSGYEKCGYKCVDGQCASTWPVCDYSVCANAVEGGSLDEATGRCVGGGAKTLGSQHRVKILSRYRDHTGSSAHQVSSLHQVLHDLDGSTWVPSLDISSGANSGANSDGANSDGGADGDGVALSWPTMVAEMMTAEVGAEMSASHSKGGNDDAGDI